MALYAFDGTGQDDSNAGNDWAAVAGADQHPSVFLGLPRSLPAWRDV